MANTRDAYQKWIETNVIDEKIKRIIDYYAYKETKGLIYVLCSYWNVNGFMDIKLRGIKN